MKKECKQKGSERDVEHLQVVLPPHHLCIIAGVHVPPQVLMKVPQTVVKENIALRETARAQTNYYIMLKENTLLTNYEVHKVVSFKLGNRLF